MFQLQVPESKTVTVDCAAGERIDHALIVSAKELIVEITGVCNEDVVVRRDNVTLRGSNPATDGIRAVTSEGPFGTALSIRDARNVAVESLEITGGWLGIVVTKSTLVSVSNCLVRGNGFVGMFVRQSRLVSVTDTVFTEDRFGLSVGLGTRLFCTRCILSCAGCTALIASQGSFATIRNSELEGSITDQTHSRVDVTGGTLDGSLRVSWKSILPLSGLIQNSLSLSSTGDPVSNQISQDSFLSTNADQGTNTTLIGLRLGSFSKAQLLNTNVGDLSCRQNSDATCGRGVTGTSSTCSSCPLPE
ncbi:hypothetical protein MYX82_00620 [Acidobacteria bacterium AH-259-D05]|nr:hypothetical protein [Acidobacteria bacterium AH-259-D05]